MLNVVDSGAAKIGLEGGEEGYAHQQAGADQHQNRYRAQFAHARPLACPNIPHHGLTILPLMASD
jgi:hypothetical protein